MRIEIEREELKSLIKGSQPSYNKFENALVKKAGHRYSDQYGNHSWNSLEKLTDEELWELYILCKD